MDLALNMLKYGPTMNMLINKLTIAPNTNIPPVLAPKTAPEIPNTVNTNPMSAVTTNEITRVMIINPMYVAMHSNHPISSITSLISLNSNAFENAPSWYAM